MSHLRIAPPRTTPQSGPPADTPAPEPERIDPPMLNVRSPFIRDHAPSTLDSAIEDTAKLARVLHLALIGAVHQDTYCGTPAVSDWVLLQELAFVVDSCAAHAEGMRATERGVDRSDSRLSWFAKPETGEAQS